MCVLQLRVSSFYAPNFVRFDAGVLKLQQMIKCDVFWGHGVGVVKCRQDHFGFGFELPSVSWSKRVKKFEAKVHFSSVFAS